ncbi:rhomboid family intramembrane serine protease [Halobacillus faecis]|uniref:Rhomboid protease GluP n=1 Tax=Halobacillus faecis TaxID=360184 RepID=A0A511WS46_9BACI|nr:rhomboid family intramembrane serine protease [Halobacillus faecis]GEN52072.1 rhomboid protease GluP [Halobacillus faecis]
MFIEQEYYLWKLTYDLVVSQDFQVLNISAERGEVWLEKEQDWQTHVVRLTHKQVNWKNELRRDLEKSYRQLSQNKKLFRGGKVQFHVVYISEYPPVEEWENVENDISSQKNPIFLYYMDDENKAIEKKKFYDTFELDEPLIDQQVSEAEMEAMLPYLKHQLVKKQQDQRKQIMSIFDYGKPRMTYFLLAVNVLIFLYIEWVGDSTSVETLIQYGAKFNPAIMEGEWWRIATSMFLHIGILHLFMNMFALYYLGTAVEKLYGTWRFTWIYLLSGLFGGVASFMLNPHVAAGASGAIFGLFGALLFFGVQHKQLFFRTMGWNLIFIVILNISFGLLVPQIDNGAHIGGMVGGFIATAAVRMPKQMNRFKQLAALVVFLLLISSMAYTGYVGLFNDAKGFSEVQKTQELNQSGAYDEVIAITSEALDNPGQYEAALRFNRSFAYLQKGETTAARKDLLRVIELSPNMAEAHYNLALLYQQVGEEEKAADHAERAADINPDQKDFKELYENLR